MAEPPRFVVRTVFTGGKGRTLHAARDGDEPLPRCSINWPPRYRFAQPEGEDQVCARCLRRFPEHFDT